MPILCLPVLFTAGMSLMGTLDVLRLLPMELHIHGSFWTFMIGYHPTHTGQRTQEAGASPARCRHCYRGATLADDHGPSGLEGRGER